VANGDLGGLAGADAECQRLADDANLGGQWRAWLSGDDDDAFCRVTGRNGAANSCGASAADVGGWVRLDGVPFARSLFALVGRTGSEPETLSALRVRDDDLFQAGTPSYASGTNPDGTGAGSSTCSSWAASGNQPGTRGLATRVGRDFGTSYGLACQDASASSSVFFDSTQLACFEVATELRSIPYPIPLDGSERLIFVSSTRGPGLASSWPGGAGRGRAAMNLICQNLAADAGLPGIYRALLADSVTGDPLEQLDPGATLVRTDGVVVGTKAELNAGNMNTAVNVDENGQVVQDLFRAWTGDLANNCDDWQSEAGGEPAIFGDVQSADPTFLKDDQSGLGLFSCGADMRLYCAQNP
jgi:hypothetical protein